MTPNDHLTQADAELMHRLQRIRELEREVANHAARIAALEELLANADQKREQCRKFVVRFRTEAEL